MILLIAVSFFFVLYIFYISDEGAVFGGLSTSSLSILVVVLSFIGETTPSDVKFRFSGYD
jgi:hypothetical protein